MKKIFIVLFISLTSCQHKGFEALKPVVNETAKTIGCQNFENEFYDGLKKYLIQQNIVPRHEDYQDLFVQYLQETYPKLTKEDKRKLTQSFQQWIEFVLKDAPALANATKDPQNLLHLLSSIDVGDQSTPFNRQLTLEAKNKLYLFKESIKELNIQCTAEASLPDEDAIKKSEEFRKRAVDLQISSGTYGARWVMATAYQNCSSERKNPLDLLTPSLEGVSIVGTHPDGIGSKRVISDLLKVQQTHYYLENHLGDGCFNTYEKPLIYDYGGKPYTSGDINSPLSLHKDAGNGTKVLGIDCSGFVFSSFAAAGLRYQKGRTVKSVDVFSWGSGSYLDPENNGMNCFKKINLTDKETLKDGDVVAIRGHVFIIDSVGSDPFGISGAKTEEDCSHLSYENFDFVIIQSSNSKQGIGLNKFQAKDYLKDVDKIRKGFERYAQNACLSFVKKTQISPDFSDFAVIRHQFIPECIDRRIQIENESCIKACREL